MAAEENNSNETAQKPETDKDTLDPATNAKKAEDSAGDAENKGDTSKTADTDSGSKETVSSFSLLDADTASDESGTKNPETKESKPAKKTEQVTSKSESVLENEQSKNISSDEVKDWLKDVRPDTTKEQEKGGGRPIFKWLAVFMILLLIAGAIAGGIYYYKQNVTTVDESETVQEEDGSDVQVVDQTDEEPSETPTPEEVDLSIYSVNVLNGSGVAGEAGSVADSLTEVGFSSPNAANADDQDYTSTIIEHKETVSQAVIDEIISVLEENYTVEVSEDVLEEEAEYDVVVTVGEQTSE